MTEQPHTTPNTKTEKPFYTRWWFIVIAVLVGIGMVGSFLGDPEEGTEAASSTTTTVEAAAKATTGSADATTTSQAEVTTTAQPTTTTAVPTTTTTSLPPGPEPAFGAGTQVVGEDVAPGLYETAILGSGVFDTCYWERLSGFSGEFEDIIANNNANVHDIVEIADTDAGFSSGCDEWFSYEPLDEPMESIPPGKWIVGGQISPGTYQAEGGDSCYWERLSGVGGGFDDIGANDLPAGSAIVQISQNDFAFNSSGCGEWNLRG